MTRSVATLPASATTGPQSLGSVVASSTGTPRGEIGFGRPLTVSGVLADSTPADNDHRMMERLRRITGQLPALRSEGRYPESGPAYTVVTGVNWTLTPEEAGEAAEVVAGSFRSAPTDRLVAELYRLRMLTMGRQQRSPADIEAEAVIWAEQLRCWPGDIVLDTLRTWVARPDGKWWPAWHDVETVLKAATEKRRILHAHAQGVARGTITFLPKPDEPDEDQRRRTVEALQERYGPSFGIGGGPREAFETEAVTKARAGRELDRLQAEATTGLAFSVSPQLAASFAAEVAEDAEADRMRAEREAKRGKAA